MNNVWQFLSKSASISKPQHDHYHHNNFSCLIRVLPPVPLATLFVAVLLEHDAVTTTTTLCLEEERRVQVWQLPFSISQLLLLLAETRAEAAESLAERAAEPMKPSAVDNTCRGMASGCVLRSSLQHKMIALGARNHCVSPLPVPL